MFQVERMGDAFVLAAMRVPDMDWQRVLVIVNGFPEVAHNYRRESERGCVVEAAMAELRQSSSMISQAQAQAQA
jgi:hypothetical protein